MCQSVIFLQQGVTDVWPANLLNHSLWNDIQLTQFPLVHYVKPRDRLLHGSHKNMKSLASVLQHLGVFSFVPSQCGVCLNQLLPLAILLCLYCQAYHSPTGKMCSPADIQYVFPVFHNSKQVVVRKLWARVQMNNISSCNPIWYDNSK